MDAIASPLTMQEQRIANSTAVDLGAGYPNLNLPEWLRDAISSSSIDRTPHSSGGYGDSALSTELLLAVCDFLGIDHQHAQHGLVTFAGSIALDRAIAACASNGASIVTSTPAIDIVAAMLSERHGVAAKYVASNVEDFDLDVDAILDAIDETTTGVVLTSPENPTGNIINAADLARLSQEVTRRGSTLVVDQCFAVIDPFMAGVPLLPNVAGDDAEWIFLWDTGKTFGLRGEKLAFLFSSPGRYELLRERLNILQFDVSARQKQTFLELLRSAKTHDYRAELKDLVRRNILAVERHFADTTVNVRRPDAGSFVLLDVSGLGCSDREAVDTLLRECNVGAVPSNSFFQPDHIGRAQPHRDAFIRLAMAREHDEIQRALAMIGNTLEARWAPEHQRKAA